ncbi:YccF domain-containing protein [Rhodoferax sp. GW822-FHT02A01]|uniref:YccF domain-containing protein n=1 Tax=Rhodoferax sp. GW822-FHT02A01 TaxID=3141537 RepID=UPI00315D37E1
MRIIGNVLWFVFGGFWMGLGWWLAGIICALSIVGLPWAKACFVIGRFAFLPFGKEAISRAELTGAEDVGTGALGMVGNILWFLVAGVWLAIGHVITACACFITIIGIPFGIQHLKLAGLALAPVGKTIVSSEEALSARLYAAQMHVTRQRPY